MISMASLQAIKLRRFCRLWRKLIEKAFQTWLEEDIEQQIEKKKEIFTDENLYELLKSVAEEEAEKKKRPIYNYELWRRSQQFFTKLIFWRM